MLHCEYVHLPSQIYRSHDSCFKKDILQSRKLKRWTNAPKPGKVISRPSHQRWCVILQSFRGSHIDQDKSIPSTSNCIFSVSLRLNQARDDRIEQKDEEAAYGEPGISLFATAESGAVLRRVALSYVELRPSGQLRGGSPEIQGAL
jgi:hypothetical protein